MLPLSDDGTEMFPCSHTNFGSSVKNNLVCSDGSLAWVNISVLRSDGPSNAAQAIPKSILKMSNYIFL